MKKNKRDNHNPKPNPNLKFILLSLILIFIMHIFKNEITCINTIFPVAIFSLFNKK